MPCRSEGEIRLFRLFAALRRSQRPVFGNPLVRALQMLVGQFAEELVVAGDGRLLHGDVFIVHIARRRSQRQADLPITLQVQVDRASEMQQARGVSGRNQGLVKLLVQKLPAIDRR